MWTSLLLVLQIVITWYTHMHTWYTDCIRCGKQAIVIMWPHRTKISGAQMLWPLKGSWSIPAFVSILPSWYKSIAPCCQITHSRIAPTLIPQRAQQNRACRLLENAYVNLGKLWNMVTHFRVLGYNIGLSSNGTEPITKPMWNNNQGGVITFTWWLLLEQLSWIYTIFFMWQLIWIFGTRLWNWWQLLP